MKDFEDYLKIKGYTNGTIATIIKKTRQHTEWLETENIEPIQTNYQDILSYMQHCQRQGVSQNAIRHYITCIRNYYHYLTEAKQIASNPTDNIKVQGAGKKTLYYQLQSCELHALYNHYPTKTGSAADIRNKIITGLLVYQGITTSELSRLETNHIKLREGQIEIPGGRKSDTRTLNLEPCQMMDIYDYTLQVRPLLLKGSTTTKLFISHGGHSDIPNYMAGIIRKLKKQNPHLKSAKQIRASVIIKWLRQYNLRETQHRAGHRYISSTEAYQQNEMEGLQEKINQYHPLN